MKTQRILGSVALGTAIYFAGVAESPAPPPADGQVMVEVRVVEVKDSFFTQVGIDFTLSPEGGAASPFVPFAVLGPGSEYHFTAQGGFQLDRGTAVVSPVDDTDLESFDLNVGTWRAALNGRDMVMVEFEPGQFSKLIVIHGDVPVIPVDTPFNRRFLGPGEMVFDTSPSSSMIPVPVEVNLEILSGTSPLVEAFFLDPAGRLSPAPPPDSAGEEASPPPRRASGGIPFSHWGETATTPSAAGPLDPGPDRLAEATDSLALWNSIVRQQEDLSAGNLLQTPFHFRGGGSNLHFYEAYVNYNPPATGGADYTGDGLINAEDYDLWRKNFGTGESGEAAGGAGETGVAAGLTISFDTWGDPSSSGGSPGAGPAGEGSAAGQFFGELFGATDAPSSPAGTGAEDETQAFADRLSRGGWRQSDQVPLVGESFGDLPAPGATGGTSENIWQTTDPPSSTSTEEHWAIRRWASGEGTGFGHAPSSGEVNGLNTLWGDYFYADPASTRPGNFFYSHAYTSYYSEPFTHTGVLGQTDLSNEPFTHTGVLVQTDRGIEAQRENPFLFVSGPQLAPEDVDDSIPGVGQGPAVTSITLGPGLGGGGNLPETTFFQYNTTSVFANSGVTTPGFPTVNSNLNGNFLVFNAPGPLTITGNVDNFLAVSPNVFDGVSLFGEGVVQVNNAIVDSFFFTPDGGAALPGLEVGSETRLDILNSVIITPPGQTLFTTTVNGGQLNIIDSGLDSGSEIRVNNFFNANMTFNQTGQTTLQGADLDAEGDVRINTGANLNLQAGLGPTTIDSANGDIRLVSLSGPINILNSTQLNALMGEVLVEAQNGGANITSATINADEILMQSVGPMSINLSTLSANEIRARSIGPNQLLINSSNLNAVDRLQIYAEGGNILFQGNVSLTGTDIDIASPTVQVAPGGNVTSPVGTDVWTNNAQFNGGGFGNFPNANVNAFGGQPLFGN